MYRLLAVLIPLALALSACSGGDDLGADGAAATADPVATAAAETAGEEESGKDEVPIDEPEPVDEIAALCLPYDRLQQIEADRFAVADDPAAADALESERQETLARLTDVLGFDAPPGVLGGLDALASGYPLNGPVALTDEELVAAFDSIEGYVGPICGGSAEVLDDGPIDGTFVDPVLTLGGAGQVSVGTPLIEAAATIGFDPTTEPFATEAEFCAYMDPAPGTGYDGLAFMVYDGVVQRIDAFNGPWRTPSLVGIGSTEDDLVAAYGEQVVFGPHPYDPEGSYVEFLPSDAGNEGLGLIFETSLGVVTSFRVGFIEPVGFTEGCA